MPLSGPVTGALASLLGLAAAGFALTAGTATAQSQPAEAARIAELEARIAELTQQLQQLRGQRPPEVRWPVAPRPPSFPAPESPLQRTQLVSTVDAGCPPGAVCLVVHCASQRWP